MAALSVVPALVFALECLSGSLPQPTRATYAGEPRRPLSILVPAHNEASGIARTLASIRKQMQDEDALLVVADNCTDATAAIARACGAEVIERSDSFNRGKGFALDFGLAHLARNPRPIVILIDADCLLLDRALDELAWEVTRSGRPAQACYLMTGVAGSGRNHRVAEFAFRVKNLVRPRGLARFGLPCLLAGTGIALPWAAIEHVRLRHDHLVEDMKLGLDLVKSGYTPIFCEAAGIRSTFPQSINGTMSQRSRWETGHLAMIASSLRSLTSLQARWSAGHLAMVADICVPPLTFLIAMQTVVLVFGLLIAVFGFGWAPLAAAALGILLLSVGTTAAWVTQGCDVLPLAHLRAIPGYMLAKAAIYPRALLGKAEWVWIRTDRTNV